MLSLPSRERGLKSPAQTALPEPYQSLPSRERGLKYNVFIVRLSVRSRSPRGSADLYKKKIKKLYRLLAYQHFMIHRL